MRHTLALTLLVSLLAAPAAAQAHSCTFTSYGTSCGPVLTGKVTPTGNTNYVSMTLTKAAPRGRVLILVGAVKWNVDLRPIFGGTLPCFLLVRPDFLQQHLTDTTGKYVWAHALPASHVGVAYAQVAELRSNGAVLTSNGLELVCK